MLYNLYCKLLDIVFPYPIEEDDGCSKNGTFSCGWLALTVFHKGEQIIDRL